MKKMIKIVITFIFTIIVLCSNIFAQGKVSIIPLIVNTKTIYTPFDSYANLEDVMIPDRGQVDFVLNGKNKLKFSTQLKNYDNNFQYSMFIYHNNNLIAAKMDFKSSSLEDFWVWLPSGQGIVKITFTQTPKWNTRFDYQSSYKNNELSIIKPQLYNVEEYRMAEEVDCVIKYNVNNQILKG